ncbi:MAG: IS1634 family transposase [Desulfosarcina sp.]|nr:IS1634 family transposase [Desulfobacterales bacterium]
MEAIKKDQIMQKMDTKIKHVDVLPMVKHYMAELGLHELFDKYVPNDNGFEIVPAQVLCMMVMNIVVAPRPLYKVDEWLIEYLDGKAEIMEKAGKYNDDRLGRCLQVLFRADRHSLMTEASAAAIKIHELETKGIHNDSTTITFAGAYHHQSSDAVQLKFGHNKDHRPDYKQIVFGLNITEDGHVPISYQAFNGNQADVSTHIPNWNSLRDFLAKEDFVYVADSKLCSEDNMCHIEKNGGKFITIMPKNRKEVSQFHERLRKGEKIEWQPAYSTEHSRKRGQLIIYQTYAEERSCEGYHIVWVHSSSKEKIDHSTRKRRISKAEKNLKELAPKLNKYYLKSKDQIENAIGKACKGAKKFVTVDIIEKKTTKRVKIGKGRLGHNTKYENKEQIIYHIQWCRDEEAIEQASKTDGIFPLITNATLPATEVLQIYKKQPFLEKRFYTKKSVLEVAPVFLKNNQRIEAMLFLYFIALMLVSLIERNIRRQMVEKEIESIPILPARMKTKTPTWSNICFFFRNIHLAIITNGEQILQSTLKGVTKLHHLILKLLQVPFSVYDNLRDGWWNFEFKKETG